MTREPKEKAAREPEELQGGAEASLRKAKKAGIGRTPNEKREVASPYVPTEKERVAIGKFSACQQHKPPSPYLKVRKKDGALQISVDHPEQRTGQILLMHGLGTSDATFANGLLNQLINLISKSGEANEANLNFMLSVIKAIEPRDEIEAMLAAQMAAIHAATMTFARRLSSVETIPQQDSAERALNKLARTFTAQIESLNRYRGKGQQKVTVEHVHVHQGGQAIVGHVEHREGAEKKPEEQPHAKQIAHAPQPPMRGPDAERNSLPSAGDAERSLPDARRQIHGGTQEQ